MEFDIRITGNDGNPFTVAPRLDTIRLVKNAFAYTIHDARISSSSGVEIEQNKFVGPISTIMRLVTQKDGDLSTYFDIIDEDEGEINSSSLKKMLFHNHIEDKKIGILRGHLPLEYIFGMQNPSRK